VVLLSAAAARASAAAPSRASGPARPVDLAAQLALATDDRKKLSEVSAKEIPRSSYTPPVDRPFSDDYFDGVSGEGSGESSATRLIVRGEAPPPEVRVMFGVRDVVDRGAVNVLDVDLGPPPEPIQTARARRSLEARSGSETQLGGDEETRAMPAQRVSAPSPASRPPPRPSGTPLPQVEARADARSDAPPARTPVAVHLADGSGSLRGELVALDVEQNLLVLATPQGEQALELGAVLVVLLGVPRGGRPTPPRGTALAVKLASGQELEGASPDYAPGAPAMTLIPTERKGSIDAVWIPAWSVVEIRFLG
jgi:hypothetical protein